MKARKPRPKEQPSDEERRKAIQQYIEKQTHRAIVRSMLIRLTPTGARD